MRHLLFLTLALFSLAPHAHAGIARWDALPAIDVMHVQGPYAGTGICPMCQHGYDAGLLVFLPSATPVADARRIARDMQDLSSAIGDERFRPFLILTGAAPSRAVLDAVKGPDRNWHVAHLPVSSIAQASRDFALALERDAHGFVFAQRRLLLAFDPHLPHSQLTGYARYAMKFLHSNHAQAVVSDNPDTPKGRLWTAPNNLSTTVAFGKSPAAKTVRVCVFDDVRSAQADALVALTVPASPTPARINWARTDDAGCFSLAGAPAGIRIHAEVFAALRDPAFAEIDATALQTATRVAIHVIARTTRASGNERIVGLPCEGCEAVFKDLPAQLAVSGRIAAASEPGEPFVLSGTVRDSRGVPQRGVILHAYQTDRGGRYSNEPHPVGTPALHARLRGWAQTDSTGRYEFHTIRPGSYPDESIPAHIHMHVIEPGRCTYYLGDVLFDDDPLLDAAHRSKEQRAHGGIGIVRPAGNARIGWIATRDITLGLNVAGYDACSTLVARELQDSMPAASTTSHAPAHGKIHRQPMSNG